MFLSKSQAAELINAPANTGGSMMAKVRHLWPLLGPAFVAAIAYVDPGNFATNSTAGASFGYQLLWVIVAANLIGMLVQTLTAKLGLATGHDLATLCRLELPRPVTWGLWFQAEIVAIATDLAEVVGGAVALNLLLGIPVFVGGIMTAVVSFALLTTQRRGHRPFERIIAGLLLVIALGLGYVVVGAGLNPGQAISGLIPTLSGGNDILIATGIVGATVMPHVIYVHSALTRGRYGDAAFAGRSASGRGRLLRAQRLDVLVAMGLVGVVNAVMLIIAAQLFAGTSGQPTLSLEGVHARLAATAGSAAAFAFAIALLASGLAASSVGTHAGQVVMEGFIHRHVPILVRRLVTLAPALVVLAFSSNPTKALLWSQVVLSLGIPFALVPLVWLTARRSVMGKWVNRTGTTVVAATVAVAIIAMNCYLLLSLAD